MRILITIMYDGEGYCGLQVQPGQNSVQGALEDAVFKLSGKKTVITASGRTDAGVHALGQTAHFDLDKPINIKRIPAALNFYLPESIRVTAARRVANTFNARISAKRKTYIYKMYIADFDNPLLRARALRLDPKVYTPSALLRMKAAAGNFAGTYDFRAFMSSGSEVKTTVRTVYSCTLTLKGREVTLRITANGFLYNMVRKILGVLLSVGAGKREPDDILRLLQPPFGEVKENAPPHGLYLYKVIY